MITFTMHTMLFVSKLCTGPCKRHLRQNHIYVCVCVCLSVDVNECVCVCVCACVCKCVHVCVCMCMCVHWVAPWCFGVNLVLKQDSLYSAHIHIQIFSASGGSWLSFCGMVRLDLSR